MSNVKKLRTITQEDEAKRGAQGVVYVLDDDPGIRSAYYRLFDLDGYLCFPYESAEAFLLRAEDASAHVRGPRCLLCDVSLPGMSGLELQSEILDRQHTMPIIFMSGASSEIEVVRAYKEGGYAFLLKPVDIDELLDTVSTALALSYSRQQEQQESNALHALVTQLTEREKSVVRLVLQGLTNQQIGDQLHIALRTVKVHRQHAMEKLGVNNVVELTRLSEKSPI